MKTCQRCGIEYEPKDERANRPSKYCSRSCGQPNRRSRVVLTCRQCGQDFERKRYMADWSQERGPFCGFRCYSKWQSEHLRGEANPTYKPEAWTTLHCGWCDKEIRRRRLDHQRNTATGMAFCDRLCFEEYARTYFPRDSYRWSSKRWRRARRVALERDGYQCRQCPATEDLVVHHIRPFAELLGSPDAHAPDNLETLCRACHRVRHNQLAAMRH